MKNFEMHCPVDGTSALQPEFEHDISSAGTIIEFPSSYAAQHEDDTKSACQQKIRASYQPSMCTRLREAEMVQSLRCGTIQGCAYNRIELWQAVTAAVVFSAAAFASIFLGL